MNHLYVKYSRFNDLLRHLALWAAKNPEHAPAYQFDHCEEIDL